MVDFKTFEDILDFAILQEKAAQQFYRKLSVEVSDPQVRLFYRTLIEEESAHEQELQKLKTRDYRLAEPDLQMLRKSGYLDALPSDPQMSFGQAVAFAIKKERSARLLYSTLSGCMKDPQLAELFTKLAEQEQRHAEYFQSQLAKEKTAPA